MYAWLIGALVVVALVAGAGWKGWDLRGDREAAKSAAAVEKARAEADARRQAEEVKARASAATLETALAKQRRLNVSLGHSLQAHIRAIPARPAGCPPERLTDELLVDVNRALTGAEGTPGGKLPATSGSPADANRPDNAGAGATPR